MSKANFADRFWFARERTGMGAPTLMRKVEVLIKHPKNKKPLSTSLISSIERKGFDSSQYSDAFAVVLGVDPSWLANGEGPPPKGFNAVTAHMDRIAAVESTKRKGIIPVNGNATARIKNGAAPSWAEADDDDKHIQRMRSDLTTALTQFAIAAGGQEVEDFLNIMRPLLATYSTKKVKGKDKSRASK